MPVACVLGSEGRIFKVSEGNSGSLTENTAFVMKCSFLCEFSRSTAGAAWMKHF